MGGLAAHAHAVADSRFCATRAGVVMLASWILTLMVALQPAAPWRASYDKTAAAFAEAATSDPLFAGERAEARTGALLVALAWHESRFNPRAVASKRFMCLFQIDRVHLADPERALRDPADCTRAAMRILKESLSKCRHRAEPDRLAFFTSGSCERGGAASRHRMFLASRILRDHPPPTQGGHATLSQPPPDRRSPTSLPLARAAAAATSSSPRASRRRPAPLESARRRSTRT
ncbi:MAG: transglycosylase SLT domain-containing protein [Polyangiaceae bacterium]